MPLITRDLGSFLLACYDEQEAALRALLASKVGDELPEVARGMHLLIEARDDGLFGQNTAVQELLADLAAKREIVKLHHCDHYECPEEAPSADLGCHREDAPCQTLRWLGLPFSQRPDYRGVEWRPE